MEQINKYISCNKLYKAAINALYTLQSNKSYLIAATQETCKVKIEARGLQKFLETEKCLLRSGITLEKLDTLSIIHVTGTKGKGSTCAYIEAILREHRFKTGFFSSPHLVTVRERIRINGQPISEQAFAEYFWKVYRKLEDTREHESDMPSYFKFLTILMFDIFLEENVDVVVIEVGIGGLYDCTNVVRNPVCVGITSLALEHTNLLGNTIEDIAYQKSGIFKPGTVAFSVPQLPEAMHVLEKRAIERKCELRVISQFDEYKWKKFSPTLQITNKIQQQNASLAIQMATEWILSKGNISSYNVENSKFCNRFEEGSERIALMEKIAAGLASCKWPGRMQHLLSSIGDFFLDGAHTAESIESCISWFNDASKRNGGKRILIFNTSGTRDPSTLLLPLRVLNFHKAYFVPNRAGVQTLDDNSNSVCMDQQNIKCEMNSKVWGKDSIVSNTVFDVLEDIKSNSKQTNNCDNGEKYQILVTGSLHLVGAVLAILDPHLTMKTQF